VNKVLDSLTEFGFVEFEGSRAEASDEAMSLPER